MTHPPVIVGAGLAGLTVALSLAPRPCVVLSAGPLPTDAVAGGDAASGWAQGGIAAALGDDDSVEQHAQDTLMAGAGLCDPEAVRRITAAAPEAIAWLARLGARFDRVGDADQDADVGGGYALGLEGAHMRHRIVHAGGDGTGAETLRAVVAAVRSTPSITVLENMQARRLILDDDDAAVAGVVVQDATGVRVLPASRVVLATGGAGGLWAHTTNPLGAQGQGLALAARAGAVLRDLEMVQFHPTALDVGRDPMPLVSEAVRGEGALLVSAEGTALLPDPLAARDVVARALWQRTAAGHRSYLDARQALGERFGAHFPAIAAACRAGGIDPATDLVPVRPAAHYHCGGVLVDEHGRSTVAGLWAVGEVASTGLHGANRLASNSLLEAVVCGREVGREVGRDLSRRMPLPRVGSVASARRRVAPPVPPLTDPAILRDVRRRLDDAVGIVRDPGDVREVVDTWQHQVAEHGVDGVDDALLTALLVSVAALARTESLGGHRWAESAPAPAGPLTPAPRHTLTLLGADAQVTVAHQPEDVQRLEPMKSSMRTSA